MPADSSSTSRTTVLTTPRTRLTTWLAGDLADLRALHSDPLTMRWLRSGVEDENRTRVRLATFLKQQQQPGWTRWRVENADGAMIGRAGLSPSRDGHGRELGYVLAPAYWGRGLASELAAALVQWHDRHPDGAFPQLGAFAFEENLASRRVLEKVGFVLVGRSDLGGRVVTRYVRPPA